MKEQKLTTTNEQLNKELKKSSLILKIFYALFICIVAILLVFSYFSIFSDRFYLKNFSNQYIVGVGDASNYENTQNGQLLLVSKYKATNNINIGDEIFYSKNVEKGSGIVQSVNNSLSTVEIKRGDKIITVFFSAVLGKVDSKLDGIGYFVWFLQSKAGVITFNIILVVSIVIKFVFGYMAETSAKGRELRTKLKNQKKELKLISKSHKKYNKTGLDSESFELLAGEYDQNRKNIEKLASGKDNSSAYKYLLSRVHDYYITKQKLTAEDREKITNCIELMALVDNIGEDEEYMLTDLILKSDIAKFDTKRFYESGKEYFSKKRTKSNYESYLMVLYVLSKNGKSEIDDNIYDLCTYIQSQILHDERLKNDKNLIEICDFIKKI